MEIQSSLSRLQATLSSPSRRETAFRMGERLDVVVEARLSEQRFLLRVLSSGQAMTAHSPIELTPGTRMRLEVTQPGEAGSIPMLRMTFAEPDSSGEAVVTRDAMRQFLPRQESMLGLNRTLAHWIDQARNLPNTLPVPVRAAIKQLLAAIPDRSTLATPEGLQRAFRHSGLFLEAKLGQSQGLYTLSQDTKVQLLRLAAVLEAAGAGKENSLPLSGVSAPILPGTDLTLDGDAGLIPIRSEGGVDAGVDNEILLPSGGTLKDSENVARPRQLAAGGGDGEASVFPGTVIHDEAGHLTAVLDTAPSLEHTSVRSEGRSLFDSGESLGVAPDLDALARKVEGALARVVMDQLASLPNSDEAFRQLQLTLPFHEGNHQDAAQLVLTREKGRNDTEMEDYWAVDLELHPPGLGAFCGRLVWNRGKLETYLWSDVAATTAHIASHTEVLEARYRQAGLDVSHLVTLRSAFKARRDRSSPSSSPLLDISV